METKKKQTSEFRIINLNEVYTPVYDELFNPNKNFITWGSDNLYPQYLINLLNRSAKHKAIVETKASMVGGNGWNKENLSPNTLNFLKNRYSTTDLDEVLARTSYDMELANSFALNIIWSKDRKSIARIDYVDISKMRVHLDSDKNFDGYLLCDDWNNMRKNTPTLYAPFSTKDRSSASQILYVKSYSPGCEFYSVPGYIGANNWIELEWEISNFHLVETRKGFTPQMIINFSQGIPLPEEMDRFVRNIKSQYQGTNGEKVLVTFSEGKDGAPTITPIELNNSDKRFIELNKQITEGIMAGHRVVNPSLFGIKTPGELGGSKDIVDYLNIFEAQYVIPRQKLLEKTFNQLLRINNVEDTLEINKFVLKLDVQTSTTDILSVLTSAISDDQKREVLQTIGIQPEEAAKLVPKQNNPQI